MGWQPSSCVGPPLLAALSDGHGSARSFRSDTGARFAVSAALAVLAELVRAPRGLFTLHELDRAAHEGLPFEIVRRWREVVDRHLAECPFTDAEWQALESAHGPAAQQAVESHPSLAYGATLLAVALTELYTLYFQLGDGDLLTVAEDGITTRPLPRDERLFANETTSLCGEKAGDEARVHFQPNDGQPPALILLSTDGYANSFRGEADFLQIGPDLLTALEGDGIEPVEANLEGWLEEASRDGSGDDISLILLNRQE